MRRFPSDLRRLAWVCLALLPLARQTPAQPADAAYPPPPITPIPPPPAVDPLKRALGELLFADKRLSRDGSRACLSCHDVRTNGAGHTAHDKDLNGADLPFNTPTVFNVALGFRLDWDGKYRTLEAQAEASLTSPNTLGNSFTAIVARLRADPDITRRFVAAYGKPPDRASLVDAIVTYERTLLTPGSRFDRWLQGDTTALSAEELNGYHLFQELGCISCHQGVDVGANLFERQGIFHPLAGRRPERLRVPSLRNVATTAPYFHNGSAPTLGEAVRRMANAQLDRSLTDADVKQIVAFLHTLTGNYRGVPVTAPTP